jgi:hypothetical protein
VLIYGLLILLYMVEQIAACLTPLAVTPLVIRLKPEPLAEMRCSHSLDRRMLEFSGSFTMASWACLRNPAT